jgi:hypothetical protein
MVSNKTSNRFIYLYFVLFFITILLYFIFKSNIYNKILLYIILTLSIIPAIRIFIKSVYSKIINSNILGLIILLFIIAVSFRHLRDIFPKPHIDNATSIGYAQYFGYPLYLDNYIFWIFIATPILVTYIATRKTFIKVKKKNT